MIRFIGANPGLTVLRGEERVAFASVWRADRSERGAGLAIVLWHDGLTRVVATDAGLGLWLAQAAWCTGSRRSSCLVPQGF